MANYNITKRTLDDFPLHLITEAFDKGMNRETEQARIQHAKLIQRKEQEWIDTHEAPYEGNFSEEYPLILPSLGSRKAAGYKEVEDVIVELAIASRHYTWLLPQIAAYINQTVVLVKNEQGLYDAQATFKPWLNSTKHKALWILSTLPRRGRLVGKQISAEGLPYSALVPLLLMPFKKFRDVKYSEWDASTLQNFVDEKLYEAMTVGELPLLDRERLLQLRVIGLTDGKGELKNPVSTYKLYHLGDTELAGVPDLAVTMLTQIWVASPHLRNEYQVLDPLNWDNQPPALLDVDIFTPAPKLQVSTKSNDNEQLPWDL